MMITANELTLLLSKQCPESVKKYVEEVLEKLIKRYATKAIYYAASFGKEFINRNEYISVLPVEGLFKMLLNSTSNLKIHEVNLKSIIDMLHESEYRVELYHSVGELYMVVGFGEQYKNLDEDKHEMSNITENNTPDSHVLYL